MDRLVLLLPLDVRGTGVGGGSGTSLMLLGLSFLLFKGHDHYCPDELTELDKDPPSPRPPERSVKTFSKI